MKINIMVDTNMEPDANPVLVCSPKIADAIAKGAWVEEVKHYDPIEWEIIKKALDERSH